MNNENLDFGELGNMFPEYEQTDEMNTAYVEVRSDVVPDGDFMSATVTRYDAQPYALGLDFVKAGLSRTEAIEILKTGMREGLLNCGKKEGQPFMLLNPEPSDHMKAFPSDEFRIVWRKMPEVSYDDDEESKIKIYFRMVFFPKDMPFPTGDEA